MAEDIQGLRPLLNRIQQLEQDVRSADRVLNVAGEIGVTSIHRTFQQQGRPRPWSPLAPATIERRRKGKGRGGARILQDTKNMLGGIHKEVVGGGVKIVTSPASVQAARQNFGYPPGGTGPIKGASPGHARTPAREFMLLQPEDFVDIRKVFERHIARK
jgi:phage gpG-like protein